ncbi:hypothetical protein SD70_27280 [Gordoniibacillus kamchatkensis]|uniref:Phage protein n=1 Tax=Gordoniibacillus kamchatkensis TaxID=1590651 RepID=A0ABR5ACK7_9BACL|nr:hypothetical protein [Paenibacillus sp. VKM B-2647]KIL38320.1 hypothetical protein SD70_27280 [Paenibacillus sp. VKM B-2647]
MTPIEQWNAMTPRERDAWITGIVDVNDYSSDISAAMEAEEKIMQMGLHYIYAHNLAVVISTDKKKHIDDVTQFDLIHASAADRCLALWLTINKQKERENE